ncbi:MAG: RIP metalloprotease RseP [Vampirovibrionales bacterium]|nr:RIP metalloprotease RseP [Vampirovibrionales bacterium]
MLPSVLTMLGLISALIIAHELGHFWVAKWCGVRVERFGFGLPMGPTLWRKKFGETEYCLHLLLFGGYVAFPDDSPDSDVPPDSKERFENQSILNRAAIAVAGITVNAIMGWAIMIWVLLGWGVPSLQIGIDSASPLLQAEAPLERAYTQKLEVSNASAPSLWVNGQPALTWQAQTHTPLAAQMLTPPDIQTLALINPSNRTQQTILPSPAQRAGLTGGNIKILAINDASVKGYFSEPLLKTTELIGKSGKMIKLDVAPTGSTEPRTLWVETSVPGKLGIQLSSQEITSPAPNAMWAVTRSASLLGNVVVQNFVALGGMLTGQIDASQLAGPVKIIDAGAKLIQNDGIQKGLILTSIISVILAVMNLLPIPPLDGSHLLYLLIEAIKGSPLNRKVQERLSQAGFIGMMALMVFILWNDLKSIFF